MTNKDLFEALRTFEKEKGIPMDYMLQNIEKAISVACKNYYGGNENVVFKVDPEKNSFDAKLVKTVVDEVFDPNFEVTVEEAQQINKRKKFIVGDEIEVPIDPKHLGWTSVSSARNVIRQGIRQGEKVRLLSSFRASSVKLLLQQLKESILSRALQQSKSARAKLLCQRANSSVMTTLKKATTLRFTLQMSKTTKEVLTQSFQEHTPVL